LGVPFVREPSPSYLTKPLSNLDAALRVGERLEISEAAQAAANDDDLRHPRSGYEAMTMGPTKIRSCCAQAIIEKQVGSRLRLY